MQNAASFESFVRGIPTQMPPFIITEVDKLSDTAFDVFLDFIPEYKPLEDPETSGEEVEEEHDLRILVSYFPQASTLSMGLLVETGIPPTGQGWALDCLNAINMFGNGYVSKVFLPPPVADRETLDLMVGWEVGLYDSSLLEGDGLKALTTLIHGIMLRLCVETTSISVQLTQMFNEQFPTGKLDS